jgi:hypothetical protein
MSSSEPDQDIAPALGAALAEPAEECPIAVVFGDGMHSCTLPRGHKEKHDYNDEPDEDAE